VECVRKENGVPLRRSIHQAWHSPDPACNETWPPRDPAGCAVRRHTQDHAQEPMHPRGPGADRRHTAPGANLGEWQFVPEAAPEACPAALHQAEIEAIANTTASTVEGEMHIGEGAVLGEVPVGPVKSEIDCTGDLVVLCTDGLTDNVHAEDFRAVIPLIIQSGVFDEEHYRHLPPWDQSGLPALQDIASLIEDSECSIIRTLPCEVACQRLYNYVAWVTLNSMLQETEFFKIEAKLHDLHRQVNEFPEQERREALQERSSQIDELKQAMESLIARRNANRQETKTDDCMIIVMRAYNSLDEGSLQMDTDVHSMGSEPEVRPSWDPSQRNAFDAQ